MDPYAWKISQQPLTVIPPSKPQWISTDFILSKQNLHQLVNKDTVFMFVCPAGQPHLGLMRNSQRNCYQVLVLHVEGRLRSEDQGQRREVRRHQSVLQEVFDRGHASLLGSCF